MAIEIISTLKPKNNGTFPIAEAKDIAVDEKGTRLDAKLTELANSTGDGSGGSGGSYVLELTAESGTLTDEQYNAVVANAPNVVASLAGELIFPYKGYYAGNNEHQFEIVTQQTGGEDGSTIVSLYLTIDADKSYSMRVTESQLASKTYVDNAVANAGGGGGGGGGIIDVTELPTEGIDEQSIYRVSGEAEVYIPVETTASFVSFRDYLAMQGGSPSVTYTVVDTLPDELTPCDMSTMTFYCYIVSSTGVCYLDAGSGAMTLGTMMGGYPDYGWCEDITALELTEDTFGIWTAKGDAKIYTYKDGKWTEIASKEYVDNKETNEIVVVELAEIAEGADGTLTSDQVSMIGNNKANSVIQIPYTIDSSTITVQLAPCMQATNDTYFSATFKSPNGAFILMYLRANLSGCTYSFETVTLTTT